MNGEAMFVFFAASRTGKLRFYLARPESTRAKIHVERFKPQIPGGFEVIKT
jgi:hypothetical protein